MSWKGVGQGILDAFQGGPNRAEAERTRVALEKENLRQSQFEHDNEIANLVSNGTLNPVFNGLTKRTVSSGPSAFQADAPIPGVPSAGGIPGIDMSYFDRADPSRIITHKTATGHTLQFEHASPTEQLMSQFRQGAPVRQIQNQMQDEAAARTQSEKTAGMQADLRARGVPMPKSIADLVGAPEGMLVLPEQLHQLMTSAGSMARPATQERIADKNNTARGNRTQALIDARASGVKSTHVTVGKDGQQSLLTVYNNGETEEAPMDATAAPPRTGPTPGQSDVMARFNQRRQDAAAKQHETLQAKEQAQWDLHGQIGDVLSTPDDETFVDPTSKIPREITMNAAQRLVFKNRYNQAEKTAKALQDQAKEIRKKYGWGEFAPDAEPQSDAGQTNPGQPSAAPTSSAPPAATNPRPQRGGERLPAGVTMGPNGPESSFESGRPQSTPKFASREQVRRYAQQKGVTVGQALKEFTGAGYTVK